MKIMVKEVGKPLAVVDTKEKYFGDCVRSYLGKDITVERVYLDGTEFMMGVDEDGLMKQLPLNFLMSIQNPIYPVQYIVGTVVFARCKPCNPYEEEIWDFEVTDVTEEDIKRIEGYLNDYYQSALRLAVQKAMYDK
jgi:hypothetical protein